MQIKNNSNSCKFAVMLLFSIVLFVLASSSTLAMIGFDCNWQDPDTGPIAIEGAFLRPIECSWTLERNGSNELLENIIDINATSDCLTQTSTYGPGPTAESDILSTGMRAVATSGSNRACDLTLTITSNAILADPVTETDSVSLSFTIYDEDAGIDISAHTDEAPTGTGTSEPLTHNSSRLDLTVDSSYDIYECRYILVEAPINQTATNWSPIDYGEYTYSTAASNCSDIVDSGVAYSGAICGYFTGTYTDSLDFSELELENREQDLDATNTFSYGVYCRAGGDHEIDGYRAGGRFKTDRFQIDTLAPNVTSWELNFRDRLGNTSNGTGLQYFASKNLNLSFTTNERAKCKYEFDQSDSAFTGYDELSGEDITSVFTTSQVDEFSPPIGQNIFFHISCVDEYMNKDDQYQSQTFGYYTDSYLNVDSVKNSTMFLLKNPAKPTNVIVQDTPKDDGGSITLNWTASQDDGNGGDYVTRYEIYRVNSTSGYFGTLNTQTPATLTQGIIENGITPDIGKTSSGIQLVGITYATDNSNYSFVDAGDIDNENYNPTIDGTNYKYFILTRYYSELETETYQPNIILNSTSIVFTNSTNSTNNEEPGPAENLTLILALSNPNGDSIELNWNMSTDDPNNDISKDANNNAEDVSNYTIWRADGAQNISDGNYTNISTFDAGENLSEGVFYRYTDKDLEFNKTYCYIIMVTDESELSSNSSIQCAQPNSRPYFNNSMFNLTPLGTDDGIAKTESDLECSVDIIDKDGDDLRDKVTFTWKVLRLSTYEQTDYDYAGVCSQPVPPGEFQNRNLSFYTTECLSTLSSSFFEKGDKVWCEVTGYDDEGENITNREIQGQDFIEKKIYINNTAPYATNVLITPSNPMGSDNLECTYTFNDIDGDNENQDLVEFEWYINNEGLNEYVTILGQSGSILSNKYFDQNDLIMCGVKVHDDDSTWIDNSLQDDVFVKGSSVLVQDNSNPQIINYYTSPYNTASASVWGNVTLVGEDVVFNIDWIDTDTNELGQVFVCDEFSSAETYTGDSFNSYVEFGDNESNDAMKVVFYSNQTGKYVNRISIRPYKIITNNDTMYAIGSYPDEGDIDFGGASSNVKLKDSFPESLSFYDYDENGIYSDGEPLVNESKDGSSYLVYEYGIDEIVRQGNYNIPNNANLINISANGKHLFWNRTDTSYDPETDFIYYNSTNKCGDGNYSGCQRLETVTDKIDLLSRSFSLPIYDMFVYEVDNLTMNAEDGLLIAKDNNNIFDLGVFNHFNPQYNAQPLPDKYLAFVLCIDNNDDDVCDSNENYMGNSISVRANTNHNNDLQNIVKNSNEDNLYNPEIILNYESTDSGGCLKKSYCSTELASIRDISCRYTVEDTDNDTLTYQIRVCDDGGACSVERTGNFTINHVPEMINVAIGSDTTSEFGFIGTDNNLMCMHNGADDETIPRNDFVLDADANWTIFGDIRNQIDVGLEDGDDLVTFKINNSTGVTNIYYDNGSANVSVNLSFDREYMEDGINKSVFNRTGNAGFNPLIDSLVLDLNKDGFYNESEDVIIYSPGNSLNKLEDGDHLNSTALLNILSFHDSNSDGNWTWNTRYPEDIVYNVDDSDLTKYDANIVYHYSWYVKPLGYPNFVLAKNFSWYDNDNNDILAHGNTMPGDQWLCQVTPMDQYDLGIAKNSSAIIIGSSGTNPTLAPVILNVEDESNSSNPTAVGSLLDIKITYNDPDSSQVKAYICNSSKIIRNSGCFEKEFTRSVYSGPANTENEMTVEYIMDEEVKNTGDNYTVMLCDPEYHCSDVWEYYGYNNNNGTQNETNGNELSFYANSIPEHVTNPLIHPQNDNIGSSSFDFSRDKNLICNVSFIDADINDCKDEDTGICHNVSTNSTFSWYRNRSGVVSTISQNAPGYLGGYILSNSNTQNDDEIWCSARIRDKYLAYSNEQTSEKITIGSVIDNNNAGDIYKPKISTLTTNSNNETPVKVGDIVVFNIEWRNYENKYVNIFLCNSSSVTSTGCLDKTLAGITTNTSPAVLNYQPEQEDLDYLAFNNTTNSFNYTIMIVNTEDSQNSLGGGYSVYNESNFSDAPLVVNDVPVVSNVQHKESDSGYLYCDYDFNDMNDGDDKDRYGLNKSIISWYKQNETGWEYYDFSIYNDKVPNSLVFDGDVWECDVQAYDGFSYGNILTSNAIAVGETAPIFVKSSNDKYYNFKFNNYSGSLVNNNENNPVTLGDNVTLEILWNDPDDSNVIVYVLENDSGKDFASSIVFKQNVTSVSPAILELNSSDLIDMLDTSNAGGYENNSYYSNNSDGNLTIVISDGYNLTYYDFNSFGDIELYVNRKPTLEKPTIEKDLTNFKCTATIEDLDNVSKYNTTSINYIWYGYDDGDYSEIISDSVNDIGDIDVIPSSVLDYDNKIICSIQVCDNYSCSEYVNSSEKALYDNSPNITNSSVIGFHSFRSIEDGFISKNNETPIVVGEEVVFNITWTDADVFIGGENVRIFVCNDNESNPIGCLNKTLCEIEDYYEASDSIESSLCYFYTDDYKNEFKDTASTGKNNLTYYVHIYDDDGNYNLSNGTLFFNHPPVVKNISVTNSTNSSLPKEENNIYCRYNITDVDTQGIYNGSSHVPYFKWFKKEGNDFVEQTGLNQDTVVSSLTTLLDQWKCEITPTDGYSNGTAVVSVPVTIGNSIGYENKPTFSHKIINGNSTSSPVSVGEEVVFNLTWGDAQQPNEFVKLFVCDNATNTNGESIINNTGCYNKTYIATTLINNNPIVESFILTQKIANSTSTSGTNITYEICDTSGLCSGENSINIFMNDIPVLESLNVTNIDGISLINENQRLNCSYNITHPELRDINNDNDDINASSNYSDHSENVSFKWYYNRNNMGWIEHNNGGNQYVESFYTQLNDLWKCELTYGDYYVVAGTNESSPIRIIKDIYDSKYPNITEVVVESGNTWYDDMINVSSNNGAQVKYYDNKTNIGNSVKFTIDWQDVDQENNINGVVSENVKLYMCNNSSESNFVNNSGCKVDQLLSPVSYNTDPIVLTYILPTTFNQSTETPIAFYLCDDEGKCSNMTNLSIKINNAPLIETSAAIYSNDNGDYVFECRPTAKEPEHGDDYETYQYKWYINNVLQNSFTKRSAILNVAENDKVNCSINVVDEYGLQSGFTNSNAVAINMIPVLWNESKYDNLVLNASDVVNGNSTNIIGYIPNYDGESEISIMVTSGINNILYNSTNVGVLNDELYSTTTLYANAAKDQNYVILHNTENGDITNQFEAGRYVVFENHDRKFYERYEIQEGAREIGYDQYRLRLTDGLDVDVPLETNVYVYEKEKPAGWFNISTELNGNKNNVYIRTNNSDGSSSAFGPAKLVKIELNKDSPFIEHVDFNFSKGKLLFKFNVTDDYIVNISSVLINISNLTDGNSTFNYVTGSSREDVLGLINTNDELFTGNLISCINIEDGAVLANDTYSCEVMLDTSKIIPNNENGNITINITVNDYYGISGYSDSSNVFISNSDNEISDPIVFAKPIQNSTNLTFGMKVDVENVSAIYYEIGNYENNMWNPYVGWNYSYNYPNNDTFVKVIKFLDYDYDMQLDDNEAIIISDDLFLDENDNIDTPGLALKDFSNDYYTNCTTELIDSCDILDEVNDTLINSIPNHYYKYFDANNNSLYDNGEPVFDSNASENYDAYDISRLVIGSRESAVLTMHIYTQSYPLVSNKTYRIKANYSFNGSVSEFDISNPILYKKTLDSPVFYQPSNISVYDVKDNLADPPTIIDVTYDGNMSWNWTDSVAMNSDQGEYIYQYEYSLGYLEHPYDSWNALRDWSKASNETNYLNIATILGREYIGQLTTGRTYYLAVKAISSFGLESDIAYSNGIIYDDRVAPVVYVVSIGENDYDSNTTTLINVSYNDSGIPVIVKSNEPLAECGYSEFATPFDTNYDITKECYVDPQNNTYAVCNITEKNGDELDEGDYTFYISCLDVYENGNTASETFNQNISFTYSFPENPEIKSAWIKERYENVFFNDTINCEYVYSDNDGDANITQQFRWYLNDSIIDYQTSSSLDLKDLDDYKIIPNYNFSCSVRSQDITGRWSNWKSSTNVTIKNYAPVLYGIDPQPSEENPKYTNSNFTLNIVPAEDPENQSISYYLIVFNNITDKVNETLIETSYIIDVNNETIGFTGDDKYNFTIKSCDASNYLDGSNCTTLNESYWIIKDITGPSMTNLSQTPINNSVNNTKNIVLNFSVIEETIYNQSNITRVYAVSNLTNGTYNYTEFNLTDENNDGNYSYSDFVNLSSGNYSVNITAIDRLDNENKYILYFHVNADKPDIEFIVPNENNEYFNDSFLINVSSSLTNYTKLILYNTSNINVTYNESSSIINTDLTTLLYFNASNFSDDGYYSALALANNSFNNKNSERIEFVLDRTKPTVDIELTSPSENNIYENVNAVFKIDWNDTYSPVDINDTLLYYIVSSNLITSSATVISIGSTATISTIDSENSIFSATVGGSELTYSESSNTYLYYIAYGKDKSGNYNFSGLFNKTIESSPNYYYNVKLYNDSSVIQWLNSNNGNEIKDTPSSNINISDSKVIESTLYRVSSENYFGIISSRIENSTINNSIVTDGSYIKYNSFVNDSFIKNGSIRNSRLYKNVTVINSTVIDSDLEDVVVTNAPNTIENSSVMRSIISDDATIKNIKVYDSTVSGGCYIDMPEHEGKNATLMLNFANITNDGTQSGKNNCTLESGVANVTIDGKEFIYNVSVYTVKPKLKDIWNYSIDSSNLNITNYAGQTKNNNDLVTSMKFNLSVAENILETTLENYLNTVWKIYASGSDVVIASYPKNNIFNYGSDLSVDFSSDTESGNRYTITVDVEDKFSDSSSVHIEYLSNVIYLTSCNDGIIDSGEECDGSNLSKSCSDYGFNSGTLSCSSECSIVTTGCSNVNTDTGGSSGGGSGSSRSRTPSYCSNGVLDSLLGETGIDCGGLCGSCSLLCTDGKLNGNEEGIDCGGDCYRCSNYKSPALGYATRSSCLNGKKDFNEEGIDCGGVCEMQCETYKPAVATCTDGEINQGEEGVDCGGPCKPCSSDEKIIEKETLPQWIIWLLIVVLIIAIFAIVASIKNTKKEHELEDELRKEEKELTETKSKLQDLAGDSFNNLESGHSIADLDNAGLYAKQYTETQGPISNSIIQLEKYIIASLDSGLKPSKIMKLISKVGWDISVAEVVMHKIMLSGDKLEEIEKFVAKQIDKGLSDSEISDKLVKASWSKEISDLIIADVHKITDNAEKIHSYIKLKIKEGKSPSEIHQILVSIGWNEHYIDRIIGKYKE